MNFALGSRAGWDNDGAMQTAAFLKDLFDLSGKVAVVIGGTGELCGAMAVGLARAGAEVVLGGRIPEKAEKRLAEIEGYGGKGYFVPVDVTSRESLEHLLDTPCSAPARCSASTL